MFMTAEEAKRQSVLNKEKFLKKDLEDAFIHINSAIKVGNTSAYVVGLQEETCDSLRKLGYQIFKKDTIDKDGTYLDRIMW